MSMGLFEDIDEQMMLYYSQNLANVPFFNDEEIIYKKSKRDKHGGASTDHSMVSGHASSELSSKSQKKKTRISKEI